ncbi:MAG: hypothetical protein FWC11_04470 [Firmicutes bacterium]|nr:hypothetical protein [Bacillota bacterium]MCL2256096.1 hypothetical protein [Bacillota bacterium]
MEQIHVVLSISSAALGFLVTTLTLLYRLVKSTKAKRRAENVIKIGNAIIPYIEQAEKFTGYSSQEKREFVITKANQYAIENKIRFDLNAVSNRIEELVRLTKSVNKRFKDIEFSSK